EAVRREKDDDSKDRLGAITRELANLNQERSELRAHWQREKELIQSIREMKEKMENAKQEAEKEEREGNLAKVAELRYGVIASITKKIQEATQNLSVVQKDRKMLKEEVDAEDIAEIVSRWTGIPVNRMLETE